MSIKNHCFNENHFCKKKYRLTSFIKTAIKMKKIGTFLVIYKKCINVYFLYFCTITDFLHF